MAKKKTSSKKPVLKKVSKKTSAKKVTKKPVAPKKKVAPVKTAKKAAVKKTPPKKAAKAVAKKSPAKKAPKKSVKPSVKANASPVKAAKSVPTVKSAPKTTAPKKTLDLSGFVTPLDDRLIVQIAAAERMTPGGLYIPDTVSDVSGNLQGRVLAVGRGHLGKKGHMTPMDVKVGDSVVFPEHAGSAIKLQNEDLIILREGDVMGIVSK